MAEALGGVGGYLQGSVGGLVNYGSSFLDKILPPEQRATLMAKINKFAAEKPALAVSTSPSPARAPRPVSRGYPSHPIHAFLHDCWMSQYTPVAI